MTRFGVIPAQFQSLVIAALEPQSITTSRNFSPGVARADFLTDSAMDAAVRRLGSEAGMTRFGVIPAQSQSLVIAALEPQSITTSRNFSPGVARADFLTDSAMDAAVRRLGSEAGMMRFGVIPAQAGILHSRLAGRSRSLPNGAPISSSCCYYSHPSLSLPTRPTPPSTTTPRSR